MKVKDIDFFEVGRFILHLAFGYGEITTISDDGSKVFIDFRNGHCDWFDVFYLKTGLGIRIFPCEKAFIKVRFKEGDNIKDILREYSDYRYVHILF